MDGYLSPSSTHTRPPLSMVINCRWPRASSARSSRSPLNVQYPHLIQPARHPKLFQCLSGYVVRAFPSVTPLASYSFRELGRSRNDTVAFQRWYPLPDSRVRLLPVQVTIPVDTEYCIVNTESIDFAPRGPARRSRSPKTPAFEVRACSFKFDSARARVAR